MWGFDYVVAYHSPFDFPVIYSLNNIIEKKKIYWLHLEMIDDENKYIGFEKAFSRYDNIVCVAKDTAKSFVKRYPDLEHKVQVIYNITQLSQQIFPNRACIKEAWESIQSATLFLI